MSQTRSGKKRASLPAEASGSKEGSPSPTKLTRLAVKALEDGKSHLAPPLLNPEPFKGRSMQRNVTVEHTAGAPAVFRRKANQIKTRLEASIAQVEVVIDGTDERAGCFVVREVGGELFVELLDMVRPFTRLTRLNVGNLVEAIVRHMRDSVAFDFVVPE